MNIFNSSVLSSISASLSTQHRSDRYFSDWFGSSVAVEGGNPKLFYSNVNPLSSMDGDEGKNPSIGIILSPDKHLLSGYGKGVQAYYVSLKNPYYPKESDYQYLHGDNHSAFSANLKALGHDGICLENGSIVIFDPLQMALADDGALQRDLFSEDFADKNSTIEKSVVVSSNGDTQTEILGNVDSTGSLITSTAQGLENFWDTFYGTWAADDYGRPLRLYHSTNGDIYEFKANIDTTNNYGLFGDVELSRSAIFMSPDISFSEEYLREGDGQNVMPVYLNLQNPLDLRNGVSERLEHELEDAGISVRYVSQAQHYWELFDNDSAGKNAFTEALKSNGYDGAIFYEDRPSGEGDAALTYVAFSPEQIKSAIGNRGTFDKNVADIRYRKGLAGKVTAVEVLSMVDRLAQKWVNAPEIHVVQSVSDMPMDVISDAGGVFYAGKVFLIADNLVNLDHAEFVLMHEVVGHYGLSGLLGNRLEETMLQIYADNEGVRSKADAWMVSNQSDDKALATEEVLSDYAGVHAEITGWKKLVGSFRKGIRAIGFELPINDLDIGTLVNDSRRFVEKPSTTSTLTSLVSRYSRLSQTISAEFKNWFGKSKVVDSDGRPLMAYQGTSFDFDVFKTDGNKGKTAGTGAFFTSNTENAATYTGGINGGNIIPVYLKLETPAIFDCKGKNWNQLDKRTKVDLPLVRVSDQDDEDLISAILDLEPRKNATKVLKARKTNLSRLFKGEFVYDDDYASTDDLARWARKQGYDGVIFKNVKDNGPTGSLTNDESKMPCTVYVCFSPEQIKSAIGNTGAFSPRSQDIRYSRSGRALDLDAELIQSKDLREWLSESKAVNEVGHPIRVHHGTPNGHISEFDTTPVFFTDNFDAAKGYATGNYARDDSESSFPVVVTAYLNLKNPKVYTEAELSEVIPADPGEIEWSDFDNLAYCLEEEGYDGVIIRGTYDYIGGIGKNAKKGRYDQYVAFNIDQIKIVENKSFDKEIQGVIKNGLLKKPDLNEDKVPDLDLCP